MAASSDSSRTFLSGGVHPGGLARFKSRCGNMLRCLELARIASASSVPVLITGESGVGKSMLARMIHFDSPKGSLPCAVLNCASMRGRELKNVLFGDSRESGAKTGLIAQAGGGTLLIDGVEQLPPFMQSQLLGLIANESDKPRLGVRLITTSDTQLSRKAYSGMFVENLVYRLGEITIRVPALRDRSEDLEYLAAEAVKAANRACSKRVKGLSRAASDFIRHYSFPGNVTELYLIIERAVRSIDRDVIYIEDLGLDSMAADSGVFSSPVVLPLGEVERRHINRVLLKTGWKKKAAARLLRISESMLIRKIRIYRLEPGSDSNQ